MSDKLVKELYRSERGRRLYDALMKNKKTGPTLRGSRVERGYRPQTSELTYGPVRVTIFHVRSQDRPAYQIQDREDGYEWPEFEEPEEVIRFLESGPDRAWIRR